MVRSASNSTQAFHVMRLLADGLTNQARRRYAADRRNRPRRCLTCGSSDVAWVWATASDATPGMEWCRSCIPDVGWTDGIPGGALTNEKRMDIGGRVGQGGDMSLASCDPHISSEWGRCSLCGRGEEGGEHLIIWCPAMANAWGPMGQNGHHGAKGRQRHGGRHWAAWQDAPPGVLPQWLPEKRGGAGLEDGGGMVGEGMCFSGRAGPG